MDRQLRNRMKRCEGMALIVAVMFMTASLLLLGTLSIRVITQSGHVDNYVAFKRTFEGVEAGISKVMADIESNSPGVLGVDLSMLQTYDWSEGKIGFESEMVTPVTMDQIPNVEFYAYAQNWANDNVDNNGNGLVDEADEASFMTTYAFARSGDLIRGAEAVFRGQNVNVWNNAIFAGAGAAGGAINGNVSIHGSVHILGGSVPEGGESVVVMDMLGSSLVHNNYGAPGALPAYLADRVPALPTTWINGEESATLEAEMRIKNGLVSLNGSAELGQADAFGNAMKETLDGVYNNDGWTGNQVVDDGAKGDPDPSQYFSDNGHDADYDLGDKVSMPMLTDDWRWPARVECSAFGYPFNPTAGASEPSPDGDAYQHGEYFADVLSDGTPYAGDVVLHPGNDFYLNLTTGNTDPAQAGERLMDDPAACVKGHDYIYLDGSTGVLEINGQVVINGNLEFDDKVGNSNNDTLYYTGRGALLVNGDVTINTHLLPCNNGNPADYALSFPQKNCLGLMSSQDMVLGESSQLDMFGAFYAQGTIASQKQTMVFGTFVANYFDMGNQVPDIYQVPSLADNLPLGMIGDWPLWVYSRVSWREVSL